MLRQPSIIAEKFFAIFLLHCAKLDLLKMSVGLFKGSRVEGGYSWYINLSSGSHRNLPIKNATARLPQDRSLMSGSPAF